MGGGAPSTLRHSPEDLETIRNQITAQLAIEFVSYRAENLSEDEVRARISQTLKRQEEAVFNQTALAQDPPIPAPRPLAADELSQTQPSSTPLKPARATATKTLEERSIYLIRDIDTHANRVMGKKDHNYLVCVDGSDTADQAFKTTCHLLKKNTKISMFHAFKNSELKNLPPMYTPDYIRNKYESQLISRLPESCYSFNWEERGSSESVLEALQTYISRLPYDMNYKSDLDLPDFVVLGYVGRKGSKGQPQMREKTFSGDGLCLMSPSTETVVPAIGRSISMGTEATFGGDVSLGSTCFDAIRSLPLPCIICKRPLKALPSSKVRDGRHQTNYHRPVPLSYVMAVNNSISSKKGLEIIFSLVKACDSLTLIHVKNVDAPVAVLSEHATDSTPFGSEDEDNLDPILEDDVASNGIYTDDSDVKLHYKEQLRIYGPKKSKFKSIKIHAPEGEEPVESINRVQRTLVSYINRAKPDFFAIAPRAKIDYSSITEYVISNVNSSIIICRN